jgi:hypothetical protein
MMRQISLSYVKAEWSGTRIPLSYLSTFSGLDECIIAWISSIAAAGMVVFFNDPVFETHAPVHAGLADRSNAVCGR